MIPDTNQTILKLKVTSALQPCSEQTYKAYIEDLTNTFKFIVDFESIIHIKIWQRLSSLL